MASGQRPSPRTLASVATPQGQSSAWPRPVLFCSFPHTQSPRWSPQPRHTEDTLPRCPRGRGQKACACPAAASVPWK